MHPVAALGLPAEPGVQVGLRPEHVKVGLGEQAPANAVRETVFLVEPMGPVSWVTVEVNGERVVARAGADLVAAPGAPAWVSADATRLHRFDAVTGQRLAQP